MKYRTYNYNGFVPTYEIHAHVMAAYRKDADPVWHEVAKTAAINGCKYDRIWHAGSQGVTFLRPTTAIGGYYNVLKTIASRNSTRWIEMRPLFHSVPIVTLYRLEVAGLIRNQGGRKGFIATEAGKAYLAGAERYLTKRQVK